MSWTVVTTEPLGRSRASDKYNHWTWATHSQVCLAHCYSFPWQHQEEGGERGEGINCCWHLPGSEKFWMLPLKVFLPGGVWVEKHPLLVPRPEKHASQKSTSSSCFRICIWWDCKGRCGTSAPLECAVPLSGSSWLPPPFGSHQRLWFVSVGE